MKIDVGTEGFDSIRLRCNSKEMVLNILMDEDFSGVIYTRGNYYDRKPDCFLDPESGTDFKLRLPYDKCEFKKVGRVFRWHELLNGHEDEIKSSGLYKKKLEDLAVKR
jgi:hypothetical protein